MNMTREGMNKPVGGSISDSHWVELEKEETDMKMTPLSLFISSVQHIPVGRWGVEFGQVELLCGSMEPDFQCKPEPQIHVLYDLIPLLPLGMNA